MLRKLLHSVIGPDSVVGVDVVIHQETTTYLMVVLQKRKSNIDIIDKQSFLDWEELLQALPTDMPVTLNISGAGVLSKDSDHDKLEVTQVIPNVKVDDFYAQKSAGRVSIARKDRIHEFLEPLMVISPVISLSLNGFALENILPFIEGNPAEIESSYARYTVTEDHITRVAPLTEASELRYKLGNDFVEARFLVAYSIAFQALVAELTPVSSDDDYMVLQADEYAQKQLFKVGGMTLLGGVLMLLVINFLVFSSLRKSNNELQTELGLFDSQQSEINALQAEVSSKNNFLTKTGWLNPSRSAFYSDQIAATVPTKIGLEGLEINPYDAKLSRTLKETTFLTKKIHVSGFCNTGFELNKWIKNLKALEWVNTAEVLEFYQKEGAKNAEFKIEIDIN